MSATVPLPEFSLSVQFVSTGADSEVSVLFNISLPFAAVSPLNTQLLNVGEADKLYTAPPEIAELPVKKQLTKLGDVSSLYMPPPELLWDVEAVLFLKM